jgi:hypothetical protein
MHLHCGKYEKTENVRSGKNQNAICNFDIAYHNVSEISMVALHVKNLITVFTESELRIDTRQNGGRVMNIAQVIKYEGDNKTFIWKHPSEDFNTSTQLIVHESQEAIFFMNGQALDLFGPGHYTLQSQNIPLIRKIQHMPTNGETPFHCEVYFINKTEQMDIKWGTDSKVQYTDPTYGFPISIGASGAMSLRAEDSRKLLIKLVGTERDLTQDRLVAYFRSILMTRIKSYIAQAMVSSKISVFDVDSKLDEFSNGLGEKLYPDFLDYGVSLEKFFVTTIVKPDGETNYERFKKIFFEQTIGIQEEKLQQQKEIIRQQTASQKIVMESAALAQKRQQEGYSYQQEHGYDVAKTLAGNEGVGNFSNAGIGLGMMAGVGGGMGAAVAGIATQALDPIMNGAPQTASGGFTPNPGAAQQTGFGQAETIGLKNPIEQDGTNHAQTSSKEAFREKLDKLVMMKESGLLSDEEFGEMKAAMLKEIMG